MSAPAKAIRAMKRTRNAHVYGLSMDEWGCKCGFTGSLDECDTHLLGCLYLAAIKFARRTPEGNRRMSARR